MHIGIRVCTYEITESGLQLLSSPWNYPFQINNINLYLLLKGLMVICCFLVVG